jgi:hypothetical protein
VRLKSHKHIDASPAPERRLQNQNTKHKTQNTKKNKNQINLSNKKKNKQNIKINKEKKRRQTYYRHSDLSISRQRTLPQCDEGLNSLRTLNSRLYVLSKRKRKYHFCFVQSSSIKLHNISYKNYSLFFQKRKKNEITKKK